MKLTFNLNDPPLGRLSSHCPQGGVKPPHSKAGCARSHIQGAAAPVCRIRSTVYGSLRSFPQQPHPVRAAKGAILDRDVP